MFVCQMYIINKPPFLNQQRLMHNVEVAIQSQKGTGLWKTETEQRRILFGIYTRVGTLIVATIYLQLIQNRYMFRSFTVLQCSHQHCVQPVASDVEVVGYL